MVDSIVGAVVAALIGGLGYLAKQWYDKRKEMSQRAEVRLERLRDLELMLQESRFLFRDQDDKTRRLMGSLRDRHFDDVTTEGFEANFQRLYDEFDDDQREIHSLIRGMTTTALRSVNERMREWLRENSWARVGGGDLPSNLVDALQRLGQHLDGWLSKYAAAIPENPKAALVYMADEKGHGVGFPSDLEPALKAYLAASEV